MSVGTNRYADYVDIQGVFPKIIEYYADPPAAQGTTDARSDLIWATRLINQKLQSIPYIKTTPLGTTSNGDYDESIKLACSNYAIHRRVWGKLRDQYEDIPTWIQSFWESAEKIMADIADGNIILETQISAAEKGISEPAKGTANAGISIFFTNSDGYGGYFSGVDFRRTWKVQIDGTSGGNGIGNATFKWSKDNGQTWEETGQETGTGWEYLEQNVYIRWEHGTGTGNQCGMSDFWTFETVPTRLRQQANVKYAQTYEFERS